MVLSPSWNLHALLVTSQYQGVSSELAFSVDMMALSNIVYYGWS